MKSKLTIAIFTLLTSCTFEHQIRFQPIALNLPVGRSTQKRVAVIMPATAVQPQYELKAYYHAYRFTNARGFFEESIRAALQGKVRQVAFFEGEPQGSFEGYLRPSLQVEVQFGPTCSTTIALTLHDASGRLVAEKAISGSVNVLVSDTGVGSADYRFNMACNSAIDRAMREVAPLVLTHIDDL